MLILICLIVVLFIIKIFIPEIEVDFNLLYPIIFIIIGASTLIKIKQTNIWNISLLIIGLWYLLININIINEEYELIFWIAMTIILVITNILYYFKKHIKKLSKKIDILNYNVIFDTLEEKIVDNNFKVLNICTIFGKTKIDFYKVNTSKDILINIKNIFGKTEVKFPDKKYNIKETTVSLFSKTDNKNKNKYKRNRKTIYIKSISVFAITNIK